MIRLAHSVATPVIALGLALVLIVTAPLAAFAQDGGPLCQGLSVADCRRLENAFLATQRLASVTVPAWSAELDLSAEGERVFFAARGSAALALPPELTTLRDTFLAVETVTPRTIVLFLNEIDSATVQTMLSETLLAVVVDEAELETPDGLTTGSAAVLLKDATLYLNLPSPAGETTWFGQSLELTPDDLAEIDAALAELRTGLLDPEVRRTFDVLGGLLLLQQGVAAVAQSHLTTTRLSDEVINARPMAVYATSLDVSSLLVDPALAPALLALIQEAAAQDPTLEPVEINQAQLRLLLLVLNLMLSEGTLTVSYRVGLDDGYLYRLQAEGALEIDPSIFATEEDAPTDPVSLRFSFSLDLADFDAVDPALVETPEQFYPGEALDNFLVGTPAQVEQVLVVGEALDGALPADGGTHIYALPLEAGQAVSVSVESDRSLLLSAYDANAFLIDSLWSFARLPLSFVADTPGVYFITVEGSAAARYRITIAAG